MSRSVIRRGVLALLLATALLTGHLGHAPLAALQSHAAPSIHLTADGGDPIWPPPPT